MQSTIVVLGKNYSTSLGVIRALGKAGCRVELLYISKNKVGSKIAGSSRYVTRLISQTTKNDRDIVEKLMSLYSDNFSTYVLMPTDDYSSSLVDRYQSILKEKFIMPFIKNAEEGTITRYMDKHFQAQLATNYGMNVAAHEIISLKNNTFQISSETKFPCFIKPLVSAKGFKSEIKKCESKQELLDYLKVLQKTDRNRSVIVQEYLDITQEYAISGACIDQEIIMPALLKKIDVGIHEKGVTVIGEISSFDAISDFVPKIQSMLQSLHYTGLFDIDLIQCNEKLYFGEINFRSSGIGYSVIKSGVNLPYIVVKALLGEDYSVEQRTLTYGKKFFYDKTGWEDYVYGDITRCALNEYIYKADFSLLIDSDDPVPGKVFLKNMKKRSMHTKIKKILKGFARWN